MGISELGFLVENDLIQSALLERISSMGNVHTHYGAKVVDIDTVWCDRTGGVCYARSVEKPFAD